MHSPQLPVVKKWGRNLIDSWLILIKYSVDEGQLTEKCIGMTEKIPRPVNKG